MNEADSLIRKALWKKCFEIAKRLANGEKSFEVKFPVRRSAGYGLERKRGKILKPTPTYHIKVRIKYGPDFRFNLHFLNRMFHVKQKGGLKFPLRPNGNLVGYIKKVFRDWN